MNRRVLVTGGSGGIGTNVVAHLLKLGVPVCSIDVREPKCRAHVTCFRRVDILDSAALDVIVGGFQPTEVVHLAARTDLDERALLADYRANTEGVQNVVNAIVRQASVRQVIFASTKLVNPTDAVVTALDVHQPDTVYGQSKAEGERIVRSAKFGSCVWSIIRPTSIWGPWCETPYGRFFRMVVRGLYVHPGRSDAPRSFGYVGNVVFQVEKILAAPAEQVGGRILYVSDYQPFTIREWADNVSAQVGNRPIRTIPELVVRALAEIGDGMKRFGVKDPPFSSVRLRNMRADTTGVPLAATETITGPLPYSMRQGVDETLAWLSSVRG